jgi:RNA polymerase subunit RPABC4/transcription elongation factor Spt4
MSTQEQTVEAPRTRICHNCSVEIHAASANCPYCGARQFRHRPILNWRGLLVCLAAVAVAVLVTRIIVDASNSGLRYVLYRSSDLSALEPTGYNDELLAGPHGTAIAGFVNPSQTADSELIQATKPVGGTPHSRAQALAVKLRNTPGVAMGLLYSVALPGEGPGSAWELLYKLEGADYAVFEFDACSQTVGVAVTLSAANISLLDELELVLPQAAQPICDGPDFSNRDRADTSVPLRSAS